MIWIWEYEVQITYDVLTLLNSKNCFGKEYRIVLIDSSTSGSRSSSISCPGEGSLATYSIVQVRIAWKEISISNHYWILLILTELKKWKGMSEIVRLIKIIFCGLTSRQRRNAYLEHNVAGIIINNLKLEEINIIHISWKWTKKSFTCIR